MDNFELVQSFTNPINAIKLINESDIDLIFLDIQMPELNGLDFAKLVHGKCAIIFTTAYPDFAVEGFEVKALDYLVKPIKFERFLNAANRIHEKNIESPNKTQISQDYIFVKTEFRLQKIMLDDIYFLKGMGDYCSIVLKDKKVLTLENLKSFDQKLPDQNFMRVHKSYLVAFDKIDFIEKGRIKILDEMIPIGSTYEKAFKERLSS